MRYMSSDKPIITVDSFKPEFKIAIFIHYKPRLLVVDEDELSL